MKQRRVLVVGGGGREHAISYALSRSRFVAELFFAPGNPGMSRLGKCVEINANDIDSLIRFARENEIDLTFIGPEEPLVMGIVDRFAEAGLRAFGPGKRAALIEGSKVFAKEFMRRHEIPTAPFGVFDSYEGVLKFLEGKEGRFVVKADGLAFGKGTVIAENSKEAQDRAREMMIERKFGSAGRKIIIEEFLHGEEVSAIALTDGSTVVPLLLSQDHKKAYDGDTGPNTGGMGAYAPYVFSDANGLKKKLHMILSKTLNGLREDGSIFTGVIYCGVILTPSGPRVLEYNCRLGDPEAQAILPLLKEDLYELCESVLERGELPASLDWEEGFCVAVVMASGGYPGDFLKGFPIEGIDAAEKTGAIVFHAGTGFQNGKVVTKGGRVLSVCGKGETLVQARKSAYEACSKIKFEGAFYRGDIGSKGVERAKSGSPS